MGLVAAEIYHYRIVISLERVDGIKLGELRSTLSLGYLIGQNEC
jgi:hypothetical protein